MNSFSRKSCWLSGDILTLAYVGNFEPISLRAEFLAAHPELRINKDNNIVEYIGMDYTGSSLKIYLLKGIDISEADEIIRYHDSTAAKPIDWDGIKTARNAFMSLPNYASWTPEEAEAWINGDIFSGQTQAEVDAWIDANVTTLATAKTGLKMLAKEIIDLREIAQKTAYMLMLLRNIVVKRSLL